MANSSTVSSGDLATAAQYNNLRSDVLDTSSGHLHDGSNGRGDGAFILQVSGLPITIENSTDNVSNQVMLLRGDNATRADGDEIYVSFNLDDDGGNTHEFARITAEATDVSNGSEDGQLRFGVSVAGTITDVFTINSTTGGAAEISYEVDSFTIKGGEGEAGVLYVFADQGDDAGDEWKLNVADGGVLTIGNDIASAGSYVTHLTLTPHATIASSSITIPGILDVNGSVDLDVTDVQVDSSGDIDLVSSANSAAAIYLHQSTGTSGTIKIHADTGTSVTEGAESINILSDVGGVGIRSTANLAKAVNITSDGGTTGSIAIFNDQGTSVTEGAESISLLSDAGGVGIRSTADLAKAINLTSDGGTTGSIAIFNDQGTSVTEGAESISILSDAGGVGIRSTANLANAVNITVDGGTTSTMTLFNDQGTTATEGSASIQLLSDVGGINIKSGLNGANAILLTADGGTSETIVIHADQGTGTGSIELLSDAGGIELDAGTDIILDADGGDIFFKDGGTTFGSATNTGGNLILKSGTTTAATFSGANVTFAGTVDATTDFTIGTTVITDDSIVMTPSTSDTVTIAGATNGVLNITTVDNAAAAANLNFVVDGAVDVDAAGAINLDAGSGIWTFEDAGTEVLRFTEGNSGDVTVKLVTNAKDLVFTDNGDATNMKILDAAAGINVPGEVQTTGIAYTDGDNAMTIADGGAVTFPVSIDVTGSAGIILENDETITNSTNGVITFSGNITVPNAGTVGSAGDSDAIAIASDGVVTMNQIPVFSAGINVSGGTITGTIASGSAAQTNITSLGTLTALSGGTGDLIWDTSLLSVDVSDSQVGIGVADALSKFHVRASDASASIASSEVIATFERNGHGYLQMLNTTSTEGGILFGDADDADIGSIVYKHSTDGFHFRTNATSNRFEIQDDGNIIGTHGDYHVSSDQRVKKEIATISGALNKVAALRGVNFKWKDTDKGTALQMGLIAQETEAVVPEVVNTASDTFINADGEYVRVAEGATPPSGVTGIKAVNYQFLVGLLIEAIKELKTTVDAL